MIGTRFLPGYQKADNVSVTPFIVRKDMECAVWGANTIYFTLSLKQSLNSNSSLSSILTNSPSIVQGGCFSELFLSVCLFVCLSSFYTSTKSWRGYIFTAVCLCVCLSRNSCERNSSRTDAPIWTRFSLNGCFYHWLGPYWIWWPWVKGQGHSDVIPIFSS